MFYTPPACLTACMLTKGAIPNMQSTIQDRIVYFGYSVNYTYTSVSSSSHSCTSVGLKLISKCCLNWLSVGSWELGMGHCPNSPRQLIARHTWPSSPLSSSRSHLLLCVSKRRCQYTPCSYKRIYTKYYTSWSHFCLLHRSLRAGYKKITTQKTYKDLLSCL